MNLINHEVNTHCIILFELLLLVRRVLDCCLFNDATSLGVVRCFRAFGVGLKRNDELGVGNDLVL